MDVCLLCVLSGRSLCDELITHPEESYRLWHVVVCDQETSRTIDECVLFELLVSLVIKTDFDHIDFLQYRNSTSYHPATDGQSWHRIPFENYDQIVVRKSDHCGRISTGSLSPRTIKVCTSNVFGCNRSTHLVHLLM
jgi:hypothetical protein